jgi:hypothetical protein
MEWGGNHKQAFFFYLIRRVSGGNNAFVLILRVLEMLT